MSEQSARNLVSEIDQLLQQGMGDEADFVAKRFVQSIQTDAIAERDTARASLREALDALGDVLPLLGRLQDAIVGEPDHDIALAASTELMRRGIHNFLDKHRNAIAAAKENET